MSDYFGKVGDIFADIAPGVIIGSLAIALALALIGSAAYALARGGNGRDGFAPLCGLLFAVSVASMTIAVGYVQLSLRDAQSRPVGVSRRTPATPPGRSLLDAADADRDGRLTPREVVELVRRADTGRKGYADLFDLDHASTAGSQDPAPVRWPADCPVPRMGPGHSEAQPSSVACFPPTGGATGHETWPMLSRFSRTPRTPRM